MTHARSMTGWIVRATDGSGASYLGGDWTGTVNSRDEAEVFRRHSDACAAAEVFVGWAKVEIIAVGDGSPDFT